MQVNFPVELSRPLSGNGPQVANYSLGLTTLDILFQFTLDDLAIAVAATYPVLEILSEQGVVLLTILWSNGLVGWSDEDPTVGRMGYRISASALSAVPGGLEVPLSWRLRGFFGGTALVEVAQGALPWSRAAAVAESGGGSGGGAVSSVFGRTGAVVAQTGDYNITQITGASDQSFLYAIIFG